MASQTTSLAFQGFMQQWHSWEAMVLFCSIVTEVAYCARYRGSWVRGADKGRHRCGQSVAQPAAPKPTESKGIPSLPMPDPAVLSSLLPPPAKSPSPNTHPHPVLSASTSRSCSPNPRLGRSIVRSTTPRSYFLLCKARGRPRVNPSPPLTLLVFEIAVANSTRCTRRHGIPATIGQSDPKLTDGPACSCCDRSHRRPSHQLSWLVWCLSTRNKGGEPIEAADQRKSRRREDGDIQRTTAQRKATRDGLRSSRFA